MRTEHVISEWCHCRREGWWNQTARILREKGIDIDCGISTPQDDARLTQPPECESVRWHLRCDDILGHMREIFRFHAFTPARYARLTANCCSSYAMITSAGSSRSKGVRQSSA